MHWLHNFLGLKLKEYTVGSAQLFEMPAAQFDSWYNTEPQKRKILGVYLSGWPRSIAKCNNCTLEIEGEYSGTINVREDKNLIGASGQPVGEHEREHEKIAGDLWNSFIPVRNSYDGKVLSNPDCCEEWRVFVDLLSQVMHAHEQLANHLHDVSEYGGNDQYVETAKKNLSDSIKLLGEAIPKCQ